MKKAFCFDLDGTLTKDEILPLIAQETDIKEEIETLTKATIEGVINFESSLKLRFKLLSSFELSTIHESIKNVRFYEETLRFIKENKENCFIITGNLDKWIEPLLEEIGCEYYSSQVSINEQGKIIGLKKILNKGEAINELRKEYDKIIAIGDGMGDVNMFEQADIGIAYGQTHNPVKSLLEVSDFVVFEEQSLCRLLNTL